MEESCKICKDGKMFKNLTAHLRTKHGMTRVDYDNAYSEEFEEIEELSEEEPKIITPADISKGIFGEQTDYTKWTVQELLDKYEMTVKELLGVVNNYKYGTPMDVTQTIKSNTDRGFAEAKRLKSKKEVRTTSLYTAEALVKNFGFKCITIEKTPLPKTWVLQKI